MRKKRKNKQKDINDITIRVPLPKQTQSAFKDKNKYDRKQEKKKGLEDET